MRDSSWLRVVVRWLPLLAVAAGFVGFFGPWIPHRAVALIVTGFELSEFAKFFPEVQAGTVPVVRPLFLTPLTATALILGLCVHACAKRLAVRVAVTALALFVALAALPQYESLIAPNYRGQLLLAVGGALLVLLTPLTRRLRSRARSTLVAVVAAGGLLGPTSQFARLHPLVRVLYNQPVGVGWGLVVCVIGFGTAAAWAIFRTIAASRAVTGPSGGLLQRQTKGLQMDGSNGIVFYGTAWCPDCRMARRVLDQQSITYQPVDIDRDPAAAAYVQQVNRGFRSVPTIVFPDGSVVVEPSKSQLIEKLSTLT